ncbi:MAG: CDP-glycerol glycerophosphotransferase family protein [Candidatus Cloacimonadota bacterium]|nr:CDP-glycerol glycerophosphotransferase family protein [Candidatus Cloacimonadota bacterium]
MAKRFKVLIDSYHLYHLPQMEPVAKLLIKDPTFDVYFSTSHNIDLEERELALKIFDNYDWKYILGNDEEDRKKLISQLNPDVFICGWGRYPIKEFCGPNTICCLIYHGIGIKPSYYRDHNKRLDIRFIEGSFREKQLRDYGVESDLELVGFAKIDPLFNGEIGTQTEVLEQLNLDPSKKTILYAPTFYPSSFEIFGLNLIKLTENYNLIIKLHQWVYFRSNFAGMNFKKQRKLIKRIEKRFPSVKIIKAKDYNIVPLYRAADVMLTEASSTIYEMMALQKHVIICDFYKKKLSHRISEKRMFKRRIDREMKSDLYDFCYHINSPRELPNALDKCFNQPDPFIKIRNKYIKKMLYKLDGKTSGRIVKVIVKHLQDKN